MNTPKISVPVYRQIAIDLAQSIVQGKYREGQKLFGRSTLAAQYKVSPETIRKAVALLKDVGILDTERGSGIEVKSISLAKEFVYRYQEVINLVHIRDDLLQWADKQKQETAEVVKKIQILVETTENIKHLNPFTPFEIKIPSSSPLIGQTVNQAHFWHNTGATIIAFRRQEELILSPGPYATFAAEDLFYIIGTEESYLAAQKLISPPL